MTTQESPAPEISRIPRTSAGWSLIIAAAGFVLLYLATSFVISNLATSPLPLPNAPVDQARSWYADNQLAAVMIGVCQLLSVSCLAAYAALLPRTAVTPAQVARARAAQVGGLVAAAMMALSSVTAWLLAGISADASLDAVAVLRAASFITGGTLHVLALGIFVLTASRLPGFGKAVRIFAYVAAVSAVVSLVSLVWFEGAVFILLGRLLCMAWTVTAAVYLTRRLSNGTWA